MKVPLTTCPPHYAVTLLLAYTAVIVPRTLPSFANNCVTNNAQLRAAIKNAQKDPRKPRTLINLCNQTILVSNAVDPVTGATGIDLSGRYVDIRCKLPSEYDMCRLEGKLKTRFFFGSKANVTVERVAFVEAQPKINDNMYGGAMSFWNNSAVSVEDCYFINNRSPLNGGAIYVKDSTLTVIGSGDIYYRNAAFSGNSATKYGGAIAVSNSKMSITGGVQFSYNVAAFSGAIENFKSTSTLKDVEFDDNKAISGSNGAMNVELSSVSFERVEFVVNEAFTWSSALQVTSSTTSLKGVSFRRNSSTEGGAMSVVNSTATLTGCEFYENYVANGALFSRKSKVSLKETKFVRNEDGLGSNLYLGDDIAPNKGGSFVSCGTNTLFCEGLGQSSILDGGKVSNTDCPKKGIKGNPGIDC